MENHVHQQMSYIFGIAYENGQLRIFGGRFIQSYKNKHGVWIYVIRRMYPGTIDYHLPRWLTFQFQEDALFTLQELYTNNDREAIRRYTTPHPSERSGRNLQNELVEDYVQDWRNLELPGTVMTRTHLSGQTALGHPSHVLERVNNESQDITGASSDESLFSPCTPKKVKDASKQDKKKSTITEQFLKAVSAKQPCPPAALPGPSQQPEDNDDDSSSSSSDSDDHGPVLVEPMTLGYQASVRRNLDDILDDNYDHVLLRRQFDNAVEQVTLFAMSRRPTISNLTFEQINQIVRRGMCYNFLIHEL